MTYQATLAVPVFHIPPRKLTVALAGGAATVSNRSVPLVVSTSDYGSGFNNVTDMKISGDIDPWHHPEWHGTQYSFPAQWRPYKPITTLVLSAGDGIKTIDVQVRNASGAETAVVQSSASMVAPTPHPSILWTSSGRAPRVTSDGIEFGWSSSHAFTAASVCLASNVRSTYAECDVELVSYGADSAGAHQWVQLDVETDLIPVDIYPTQAGHKFVKVFVQVAGTWYGAIGGL